MSATYKGLIVTFEGELNEEYVKELVSVLYKLRHVINVQPVQDTYNDVMNREMVRREFIDKILSALKS